MTKRGIILVTLLTLFILVLLSIRGITFLHSGMLSIIFCDVGQGDAIIIKSPQGKIITLDGGPDESFSRCLSSFLPFWHRTIDLMIVSHPHADHFVGNMAILQEYKVKAFATEDLSSDQKAYQLFLNLIQDKKVPEKVLSMQDAFSVGQARIQVVGPSREFLASSSPGGNIGERSEFASLILLISFGETTFLLSGDSQAAEMAEAVQKFGIHDISVLQSPHHGSATGLNGSLMATLKPKIGIISVGEANRYGHPAGSTLKLFDTFNVPVKRTDREGTIELISDGKTVKLRTH